MAKKKCPCGQPVAEGKTHIVPLCQKHYNDLTCSVRDSDKHRHAVTMLRKAQGLLTKQRSKRRSQ